MSKKVLIVEIDSVVSSASRAALEAAGFSAEESSDPKGCVELIRGTAPDLVVLAVDLGPGQSGYLICSKLKKDSDLKGVPVMIIGPPDGFEKHSKLKTTRADDYVAKPFEPEELVARIGRLIGFPDDIPVTTDDSGFGDLLEADTVQPDQVVSVEEETTIQGDPDLAIIDEAFDSGPGTESVEETSPAQAWDETSDSGKPAYEANGEPLDSFPESGPDINGSEPQQLLARVDQLQEALAKTQESLAETQAALEEAQRRTEQAEARARSAEPAGSKTAPPGKSEKDYFALKDALSKRDREILQLKTQLTERDKEILELHDRETHLEQQIAETAENLAQRESELAGERERITEVEGSLQQAQSESLELRGEVEGIRGELEAARSRIREMESSTSKSEARIEKLYERIKGDEKLREKTKKALSIALQLLDEQQSLAGNEDEPAAA
jgi:CheY-like chemotaxis protein